MTKSWKPAGSSARSEAKVTIPDVEQEPHFRVIRCTRTSRGRTFNRCDHCSTRARINSRRCSVVFMGAVIQQDSHNTLHNPAPFRAVKTEQRAIQSRAQPPLLVGIDGSIGEALKQ